MKIGVFDSGLGGLWMLQHIRALLPEYNYVFFGDQAHVPYGNKTVAELFEYTTKALTHLYEKENCGVVILACNTTSATIYTELREWVNENYPERLVFGVVRPTVEALAGEESLAFFGTHRTIESHTYGSQFSIPELYEIELPELATLIERDGDTASYLNSYSTSIPQTVTTGVLVCTHYGIVREEFQKAFPQIKKWVYQEDIIPSYLASYFKTHERVEERFFKASEMKVLVSAPNPVFEKFLGQWFVESLPVHIISL